MTREQKIERIVELLRGADLRKSEILRLTKTLQVWYNKSTESFIVRDFQEGSE